MPPNISSSDEACVLKALDDGDWRMECTYNKVKLAIFDKNFTQIQITNYVMFKCNWVATTAMIFLKGTFDPKAIQLTIKRERAIWWAVYSFPARHWPWFQLSRLQVRFELHVGFSLT